jgi:hypothetical protein
MGRPAAWVDEERKRLAHHLLSGLWREAELGALEYAIAAGVLERVEHPHGPSVLQKGTAIAGWTTERVTLFIRRVFGSGFSRPKTGSAPLLEWEADHSDDDVRTVPLGTGPQLKVGSGKGALLDRQKPTLTAKRRRRSPSIDCMALIRLVRSQATPPSSVQVATLLMLADAVARSGHDLAEVLAVLRRPRPIIAITGIVAGFEVAFVDLLKRGLVLPGRSTLINGYTLRTINDVRHGDETRRSLIVFGARDIEDAEFLRKQLDLAAQNAYPILAVADAPEQLPAALVDAADLHLVCSPISESLLAEIIKVVVGREQTDLPLGRAARGGANGAQITPHMTPADDDTSSRASPLERCALLSLLHLGLAIRPGMSADACLKHLRALIARQQAHEAGESTAAKTAKSNGSSGGTTSSRRGNVGSGSTIIEPEPLNASPNAGGKPPLRVETLSGYGAASEWALGLKQDLTLWQAGHLEWLQMSTRLLLAGPPGTGKTTFARALANTLQTKLLVTSVGTWLEPSHLGDVLARMAAAFAEAEANAPCILFVDEIDGIGKRGGRNREYDDYWNSVVNRALELVDGALKTQGVIIVGATNHPEAIDPALLRSGRLETRIDIPLPDVDALVGILRHHLADDVEGLEATVEAGAAERGAGLTVLGKAPPPEAPERVAAPAETAGTQPVARGLVPAAATSAALAHQPGRHRGGPVSRMLAGLRRVVRRWPCLSRWWPASLPGESERELQDGGK